MGATEIIEFLHKFSQTFLTEEIITVRLTTVDGERGTGINTADISIGTGYRDCADGGGIAQGGVGRIEA